MGCNLVEGYFFILYFLLYEVCYSVEHSVIQGKRSDASYFIYGGWMWSLLYELWVVLFIILYFTCNVYGWFEIYLLYGWLEIYSL